MQTPKLITFGLLGLLLPIAVSCVPLDTQETCDILHQPDRHIEPREPLYPLVSSETRTATGSFTESYSGPPSNCSHPSRKSERGPTLRHPMPKICSTAHANGLCNVLLSGNTQYRGPVYAPPRIGSARS